MVPTAALGVGGSITGMGFDRGIIDDPVRRADARSAYAREGVWEWFRSDFWTRRQPGAKVLLTLTRWHHDDLAGRLLKLARMAASSNASSACPPRLMPPTTPSGTPTTCRPEGEALWPTNPLFTREAMDIARVQMGPYAFESLHQQRPTPREGGLFTTAGLSHLIDTLPCEVVARVVWDKGTLPRATGRQGCVAKHKDGRFVIEDVARLRAGPDERNHFILATAERDDADAAHGTSRRPQRQPHGVLQIIEQPPRAGRNNLATDTADGRPCRAGVSSRWQQGRTCRAAGGAVRAGNVMLCRAVWSKGVPGRAMRLSLRRERRYA